MSNLPITRKMIMNTKPLALAALIMSSSTNAQMFENNYVLFSPSYSDVSVVGNNQSEAGFSFAFGTEIHKQWYAEVGYSSLAANYALGDLPSDLPSALSQQSGVDAGGAYLAFLGKAKGQTGELFYRLGVITISAETQFYADPTQGCTLGESTTVSLDSGESALSCYVDESDIAGMIGIGFDTFIGYRSQIRLAVDHIRGPNDIKVNQIQLGYRFNF